MAAYNDRTFTLEDVRLIFRNFAGKEGQYNQKGQRGFSVLLDDDIAKLLETDGWNVKWLEPREEEDPRQAHLPVSLRYDFKPPRVIILTHRKDGEEGKRRTPLGEEEVELLDWADIETVDLIVRPYDWSVNGKSGIKAYLQSMYVTISEDPLELKYSTDQYE